MPDEKFENDTFSEEKEFEKIAKFLENKTGLKWVSSPNTYILHKKTYKAEGCRNALEEFETLLVKAEISPSYFQIAVKTAGTKHVEIKAMLFEESFKKLMGKEKNNLTSEKIPVKNDNQTLKKAALLKEKLKFQIQELSESANDKNLLHKLTRNKQQSPSKLKKFIHYIKTDKILKAVPTDKILLIPPTKWEKFSHRLQTGSSLEAVERRKRILDELDKTDLDSVEKVLNFVFDSRNFQGERTKQAIQEAVLSFMDIKDDQIKSLSKNSEEKDGKQIVVDMIKESINNKDTQPSTAKKPQSTLMEKIKIQIKEKIFGKSSEPQQAEKPASTPPSTPSSSPHP